MRIVSIADSGDADDSQGGGVNRITHQSTGTGPASRDRTIMFRSMNVDGRPGTQGSSDRIRAARALGPIFVRRQTEVGGRIHGGLITFGLEHDPARVCQYGD